MVNITLSVTLFFVIFIPMYIRLHYTKHILQCHFPSDRPCHVHVHAIA